MFNKIKNSNDFWHILCLGFYFISLTLSNLLAHKTWGSGYLVLSAGTLPIPLTYLILNITTYSKGLEYSNYLIIAGVTIELFFAGYIYITTHIYPHNSVLAGYYAAISNKQLTGSIAFLLGMPASMLINNYVFSRIRGFIHKFTNFYFLALISTILAEAVAITIIFPIAFHDKPLQFIVCVWLSSMIIKIILDIILVRPLSILFMPKGYDTKNLDFSANKIRFKYEKDQSK